MTLFAGDRTRARCSVARAGRAGLGGLRGWRCSGLLGAGSFCCCSAALLPLVAGVMEMVHRAIAVWLL